MGSVWRDAQSIADLGRTMADWLEGRIPARPGYFDSRPDTETSRLITTLAVLNRAGFVTVDSQPGEEGPGYDGAHWRQKAYVEGYIDDRGPLLPKILRAADTNGLSVIRASRKPAVPVPFADRDGQPVAGITTKYPRNQLAREWDGIGRRAFRDLRAHSVHLIAYDPVWGRDDRLWTALMGAVR
ncbi:DUF6919 domain-containing protein [Streptomyces nymphaeiformis]|uniref:DUF6919 domain-containing protein n=1 Tax=Streptomyces nymphaeiformis TaxID=2663842 RepID=A0A7W7XF25_9ACTN|nr:hypothetical protein [Streptomyces nymphaeiformis]MBB4985006.1 hypothetical protein [Streptomyces nymphaeiformis]